MLYSKNVLSRSNFMETYKTKTDLFNVFKLAFVHVQEQERLISKIKFSVAKFLSTAQIIRIYLFLSKISRV